MTIFQDTDKAHHATKAKADRLAETLAAEYPALSIAPLYHEHDDAQVVGFQWVHTAEDGTATQIGSSKKVPELADILAACEDADLDPEEGAEEEEQRYSGSVVDQTYREQYKERSSTGQSCGDFLAEWLTRTLDANGKLDYEYFVTILSANGVDLTGKWAQVVGASNGWQGRYRMNGRQKLEKQVVLNGKLLDGNGDEHEVDAEWLTAMEAKHGKWLAKERKRLAAEQEVAEAAAGKDAA